MTDEEESAKRRRPFLQPNCFRRILAGFGFLLFSATIHLWMSPSEFPQIPFFAVLSGVPRWLAWLDIGITTIVGSLLVAAIASKPIVWQRSMAVFAVATAVLVLFNQHRFQPWVYQLIVFAVILASCRQRVATRLMQWIVASIYAYSAVSKLDYQFLHSLGPQFLVALTGSVGLSVKTWASESQAIASLIFPIGELCIGVGLLFQRTRRFSVVMAVASHLMLLLILGPWGLNHRPAVLIWNMFFIAQACVLFAKTTDGDDCESVAARPTIYERMCYALAVIVIAFPATESLGYCDHWPAWELYSPRNSRSFVAIHESAIDRLPEEIQLALAAPQEDTPWRQLHLDRWSLDSLDVPVYPEDRFQTAVALAVAERYDLQLAIHVTQQSASNRWTGERDTETLRGRDQIAEACRDFFLSVEAR